MKNQSSFSLRSLYNRFGFAYLVFLLIYFFGTSIVTLIIQQVVPQLLANNTFPLVLNYLVMYLIGFPIFYLIINKIPDSAPKPAEQQKLKNSSLLKLYTVCWTMVIVLNWFSVLLNNGIGSLVNGYNAEALTAQMLGNSPLAMFICGALVAPTMEEIMFRWLPYKKLAKTNPAVYMAYTSLAFGLIHLNFGQFFYALALGLLFSAIVVKTGKIRYTIFLHCLVNITGGAGIGRLVAESDPTKPGAAIILYGFFVMLVIVLGIVFAIIFLGKNKQENKIAISHFKANLAGQKKAFLNPGSLCFFILSILLIIFTIVSIAKM